MMFLFANYDDLLGLYSVFGSSSNFGHDTKRPGGRSTDLNTILLTVSVIIILTVGENTSVGGFKNVLTTPYKRVQG